MNCSACGHENRAGAKFCEECAAPLKRVCASCGAELRPTARFCDECAAPVAAGAQRAPQGAAGAAQRGGAERSAYGSAAGAAQRGGAERSAYGSAAGAAQRAAGERSSSDSVGARKVVTIVFADLVGSTALHERLDAEAVRQFMEGYYAAMRGAVEAHGGTVTQLLGDGVKAVFGAPRVAEDDAIRAVRAAVEMQRAFRELAERRSGAVGKTGLRVAVNTGEVVADEGHEIIGDPVNVAARLQEQGRDGDVVIGEATQRLVASLVTLVPLGSFALKGRAEAVKAYRLESLEPPAGAATAAFVGREGELARVGAVFETATEKPATALVVVLGSPGLGKSRLIDEFARLHGDAATIVSAHCDAAGGATFAPLAVALRELLGIEDGAGGESLRAAVEGALPSADADRARIAGGIASLLGGSPASPEETFFVVRRLLAALAHQKPVVLVIDDLHWAEPLLLDLVEHLVQWGSGVPLLVLVGARPELRDARSSLAVPGGFVADVITLSGLDAGAATRLAANVLGAADLPAALAARLLATSEGNPLFVGELVKMLVQEGVIERQGERWIVGAALAELEMPPTIHALLAARIERLRPEDRAVLERAAVVGRHFSRSAVAALLPRETTDLDARLEALRRSELIERDTGWMLGEPVLRFHHVLIRDAAYRRLLKGTRAELHARLADWIAAQVGDAPEHDETIGWHLEQAHQHLREIGPLDEHARVLGERAAARLAAAGRRALARDDVPLAAGLLGRAFDRLAPEAPERADLALDWCEALLSAGDVGPAAAAIEELARFAADSERLRAWHACFAGQLTVLTAPQELQATADSVARAARDLAALGDAAGEAKAHFVHAQALMRLGRVGACEAALDQALAAARRANDSRRSNAVLAGAPLAALWGPSPVTRASGRCLDVVRVLRITQGAPAVEAVALSCQGVLEALRGRTEAARRMLASSRRMVEELGIAHRLFEADAFVGRIDLLERDAPAAERALRGAYDGLRELGLGIDAARAGALLARALLAQDRAAEAEALSHESEALAGDDLQAAIAWRGVRAEALARRGEHAAAIELARAAVEIAAATDALLDHADARVALATALRAAGRSGEADDEERRAIELWEAKGATLLAERARGGGALQPVERATEDRVAPARGPRRRARENAATVNAQRLEAAVEARAADALPALFADELEVVDHTTGVTFDRQGALSSFRSLIDARDARCSHETLATLGDELALCHFSASASGLVGGRMDVGAYEKRELHVSEVDAGGRRRRGEVFATEHLGDAIARLYERHAELLPEGPERERAAATARSARVMLGQPDLAATARVLAPDVEFADLRTVGPGTLRGADAVVESIGAMMQLSADDAARIEDVLALRPDALVVRWKNWGTDRSTGGTFERSLCQLWRFGADGRIAHWQQFELEQADEALARFDELTADAEPGRSLPRRVRANAATRNAGRSLAALAARDIDALAATWSDPLEVVHHPTRSTYGAPELLKAFGSLFAARSLRCEQEILATLGESLALLRRTFAHEGSEADDALLGSIGPVEIRFIFLFEVDERGLVTRSEGFAADRLGDAVARLYERYAELLPAGPERARAEATARSVAMMLTQSVGFRANVFAPSLELVDHRSVGYGTLRGAEAMQRAQGAWRDVADDFRIRIDDVLAASPDALVRKTTASGVWRESGGAFERTVCALSAFDADGLVARQETWDADREADALARFDELAARSGAAARPLPIGDAFANAAARADRELFRCFDERDWDGVLACAAPELVFDERRRMLRNTCGREVWLEQFRVLFDVPEGRFTSRLLATRGERLSLHLHRFEGRVAEGGGPLAMDDHFALHEVDRQGRIVAIVLFDLDDRDAAYAELDARYAVGESAAHPLAAAWLAGYLRAFAARDWDAMAALFAADLVAHNHRLVGWGTLNGPAALLSTAKAQVELAPDTRERVDHVRLGERGVLFEYAWYGTREGGDFENLWVVGVELDAAGRARRVDVWEAGQVEHARARFARIAAYAPPAEPFANAATRALERGTAALGAGDWEGFAALFAADFRVHDRTSTGRFESDGTQWLAAFREMVEMTSGFPGRQVLATRGERLAVARVLWRGAQGDVGPSEVEWLLLIEVDGRGDHRALVSFDPVDLHAAFVELEARWAAGEATAHPRASAWAAEFQRGFASRDWGAMAALTAPGQVAENHRLVGWGTLRGAGAWVPTLQRLVDLAPDVRLRLDHLRTCERGLLHQLTWQGTREGGAFDTPLLLVVELDADGREIRLDVWDVERLEAARARFEEIRALEAPPSFANTASRTWQQILAAWERRDARRFAELHPRPLRYRDHRRQFQLDLDREQFLEFTRPLLDMAVSMSVELLATRGERLALERFTMEVGEDAVGPSAIESLIVIEADERGDIAAYDRFDLDDLDAARAELDARWQAGEGAGHARAVAFVLDLRAALSRRDWDAVAALYAPNFVADDHRLVSWGTRRGPAAFLETQRAMVELAPDVRVRTDHVRTVSRGSLSESVWVGTRDGGAFESPYLSVVELDAQGRALRNDLYDLEHLDRARVRFEAIAAAAPEPLAAIARPNAATAAMDRWLTAYEKGFGTGDWEPLRAITAPGYVFDDRRRLALLRGDAGLMIASARERAASGARPARRLMGTAGDRVDLERILWSGGPQGGRFEIEYVGVTEVDASGLLVATVLFDPADAREAQREAWARWFAIDPAAASVATPLGALVDAFNEHDPAKFRACLADDLVVEDHRLAGMGRMQGADAYVESVEALLELAPDTRGEMGMRWPAFDRHGALTVLCRGGRLPDGGAFESEYLFLYLVARGRISRVEMFDVGSLEAALARFEALRPDPLRIPPNAAVRVFDRNKEKLDSVDVAALRSMVSDDFSFDDRSRRAMLRGGVEEWIRAVQFLRTEARAHLDPRLLATAGDRLALHHFAWQEAPGESPFRIERLCLTEIDGAGGVRAFVLFDVDQRADASAELLERFARVDDGMPAAIAEYLRAWNDHDMERARAALPDDFVLHDRRRTGIGRVDRDGQIAAVAALHELSRDVRLEVVYQVEAAQHGRLWVNRWFGTNAEGGAFEAVFVAIVHFERERIRAIELFEPDDLDAARVRFEKLGAERTPGR
jgi:class 3 adenylate cyclase/ketosteroid isomerase-like protein